MPFYSFRSKARIIGLWHVFGTTLNNRIGKWALQVHTSRLSAVVPFSYSGWNRALGRKGPWHHLGCRHSSDGRGSRKSVCTATRVFRSSSSAQVFPVGLTGRNDADKHSSQSASVSWLTLWMLKPQASSTDCKFSLHWGICNAWLSYCNAWINLLFLSVGDHIHLPLLLCVILVFQLTFDSRN